MRFLSRLGRATPRREPTLLGSADALASGGGDRMGSWAESHRTGDPTRADRRALRVSVFGNVMQLFVILALVLALNDLLPLRRDVPYLLEVRGYDHAVADVRPLVTSSSRERILAQWEVARYVRVRNAVVPDLSEMDRRWGRKCVETTGPASYEDSDLLCSYIYLHSSQEVYGRFLGQIAPVKAFVEAGKSRRIKILSDPLRVAPGQYEVRFAMIDYGKPGVGQAGPVPDAPRRLSERHFLARLWVTMDQPQHVDERLRFLNPSNFRVVKYELVEAQ